MCRKAAQLIQRLFAHKGAQSGKADFDSLLLALQKCFVQLLLLRQNELFRAELGPHLRDIAGLPEHGGQQPLFCRGNPQRLRAARTVRHADLVHLTGLQPCLILRPPAFAVGALYCIGKLGHNGVLGDVRLLGQPPGVDLLLGGVGALRQHIHGFFDIFQPLGILLEVVFVLEPPQPEVQRVAHAVQQCLEPLGAILFDVLIRIFCTRDLQHTHLDRAVAEQFQRAQGGLLAGLIRVVAQDDFLRILADELYLIRSQGRAAGADRRVDARLMHGNNVHVTLAENEPPGSALLGDLQRKHRL